MLLLEEKTGQKSERSSEDQHVHRDRSGTMLCVRSPHDIDEASDESLCHKHFGVCDAE